MAKTIPETDRVLRARKKLTEAFHSMHVDQEIHVSAELAKELDRAWMDYDRAVVAQALERGHMP